MQVGQFHSSSTLFIRAFEGNFEGSDLRAGDAPNTQLDIGPHNWIDVRFIDLRYIDCRYIDTFEKYRYRHGHF